MSGFLEVEPEAASAAATRLEQVAQEVNELLARTGGELTTPPALAAGGSTAQQIMKTYGPQLDNVTQGLAAVQTNANAVGQTSAKVIEQLQNHEAETSGQLKKLHR